MKFGSYLLTKDKIIKISGRLAIFVACLLLVIFNKSGLNNFFTARILGVELFKWIWFAFIIWLVGRLLPKKNEKMASGKRWKRNFSRESVDKKNIMVIARQTTLRAYKSQWLYLLFLFGFYFAYFIFQLNIWLVIVFTLAAAVLDAWCVSIWCPFRSWLIRNKCCNNCRIFNWGYIMVSLPLLVIPSFWTYSIVFVALLIFIQWEYLHFKHPERFYEISNRNLRCSNCPGRTGFCRKVDVSK